MIYRSPFLNRCSAVVGKVPTVNRVSLGQNCLVKGIVLHELMHALGFIHEQNRSDRDEFVKINFDNIRAGTDFIARITYFSG